MNNYQNKIITSGDVIINNDLGKNKCVCLTWIWSTQVWCENFGSDRECYLKESESQLFDNSKDGYNDYSSVGFFFNSDSQIMIIMITNHSGEYFINDHFKDVLSKSIVDVLNRIKTSVN